MLPKKAIGVACAALLTLYGSASASAQDNSWSGLYIGAHVGGAWSSIDYTRDFPGFVGFAENFSHGLDGVHAGGHIGLQHQFGSVVLGVEASLSGTEANSKIGYALQQPAFDRAEIASLYAVSGKIGFTGSPRWMAYLKGGFASGDVTATLFRPDNGVFEIGTSKREHGWTIGGGLDYRLSSNLILGIAYDYVTLDTGDRSALLNNGNPITTTNMDVESHAVTARLSFLFGRPAASEPMK